MELKVYSVIIGILFILSSTSVVVAAATTTEDDYPWMNMAFTDVNGQRHMIADAVEEGPVIFHLFATWCASCSRQLKESTKFVQEHNEKITIISLDIDPNESDTEISHHIAKNQYVGIFAAAQRNIMQSLSNDFGSNIALSLPQTLLITKDSVQKLDGMTSKRRMKSMLADYLSKSTPE